MRPENRFNFLRRVRQHADAVLLFISDLTVPFTNNTGERAVRMPKVKQKISGCFRTVAGAEHFCVILACLDTLRKQGYGMLDVLQRAFAAPPIPVSAQRLNSHQLAWAGAANGCTASLSPIALRIASKLLSAGLPFGESVR